MADVDSSLPVDPSAGPVSGEPTSTANPDSTVPRNALNADLIAENISLLARTGNGLSYAFTRLELHGKPITDLDILESYPHLRYIDVSENNIQDISGLSHLEYLLSLDVHGNHLKSVPASVDKRKYLQHANFAKNQIGEWNASRWPMLTWLNLNGIYIYIYLSFCFDESHTHTHKKAKNAPSLIRKPLDNLDPRRLFRTRPLGSPFQPSRLDRKTPLPETPASLFSSESDQKLEWIGK
jgi:Leucine-rich repeat (LRR) protein